MAKNCVGLDIGSAAVKVIQLKPTRSGMQLVNFGIEPVPVQSIVEGAVMDAAGVAESIRSLLRQLHVRRKEVALAIAGNSAIIKKITVPNMTREEFEETIQWEAEHHIPFAKDDVEIDYQILQANPQQNQMDVLLVAAKKEVISDYVDAVREAQLHPVVVDIAAFCLQNCFELNYGHVAEAIALINVGASTTTINVVDGGQSAFTRDVATGGHLYTEEIQKQLGTSFEEAEAYKCGGTAGDEVIPQEVERIIAQQSDVVAGEIQRSLDFYLATTASRQIDRVYMSGGSARIPVLREAVESRARVPVELFNPFQNIQIDESAFDMDFVRTQAPMAAIAVGLALRSEGDSL